MPGAPCRTPKSQDFESIFGLFDLTVAGVDELRWPSSRYTGNSVRLTRSWRHTISLFPQTSNLPFKLSVVAARPLSKIVIACPTPPVTISPKLRITARLVTVYRNTDRGAKSDAQQGGRGSNGGNP